MSATENATVVSVRVAAYLALKQVVLQRDSSIDPALDPDVGKILDVMDILKSQMGGKDLRLLDTRIV